MFQKSEVRSSVSWNGRASELTSALRELRGGDAQSQTVRIGYHPGDAGSDEDQELIEKRALFSCRVQLPLTKGGCKQSVVVHASQDCRSDFLSKTLLMHVFSMAPDSDELQKALEHVRLRIADHEGSIDADIPPLSPDVFLRLCGVHWFSLEIDSQELSDALLERELDTSNIWIGRPVLHSDVDASSLLLQAASNGNLDQARWAVEHCGVSPNDAEDQDQHALHIAAKNNVLPMLRYLVRVGSNVDVQSKNGQTPLHVCSYEGNFEFAELLLLMGADAHIQDHNGDEPADVAKHYGHSAIVRLLGEF